MKNYQQKSVELEHNYELKADPITKYMATDLITFSPETPIIEVIDVLVENSITGAPVLNEVGEVIGLIDDKDCLRVLVDSAYHNHPVSLNKVKDYMSNVMKTIRHDADIVEVANLFLTTPYKRFVVINNEGKLVGQISRRDILRAIQDMEGTTWHKK